MVTHYPVAIWLWPSPGGKERQLAPTHRRCSAGCLKYRLCVLEECERCCICGGQQCIYLSNARAWLLDFLTPSLPVPTDDVVIWVFIESSALEQVVAIHSGMAAEGVGQASGNILSKSYVR
ncbi:hypothetical protein TNCV_2719631 [Trichonephila clavipes]|nr:hypothetical protein TNCV_2719631 [Trichonephila clavipes]